MKDVSLLLLLAVCATLGGCKDDGTGSSGQPQIFVAGEYGGRSKDGQKGPRRQPDDDCHHEWDRSCGEEFSFHEEAPGSPAGTGGAGRPGMWTTGWVPW